MSRLIHPPCYNWVMQKLIECDTDHPLIERGGKQAKYPWRTMPINSSFFTTARRVNTTGWTEQTGKRFTQRKVIEDGVSGLRVWRIE